MSKSYVHYLTQRVMPQEFLVLQRFFLRVDNVLFRIFDTRIYCSFQASDGEPLTDEEKRTFAAQSPNSAVPTHWPRLIRECRGTEASYAAIKNCLPPHRPDDLSPLTNVAWVAENLEKLQYERLRSTQHASVAPARTPHTDGTPHAAVLGEVNEAPTPWQGDGYCLHVAVLRPSIVR